jgi:hypothetical protein
MRRGFDISGTLTCVALDSGATPVISKVLMTPNAPDRDPAHVAADERDELVSVKSARRDYAIASDAVGLVDIVAIALAT